MQRAKIVLKNAPRLTCLERGRPRAQKEAETPDLAHKSPSPAALPLASRERRFTPFQLAAGLPACSSTCLAGTEASPRKTRGLRGSGLGNGEAREERIPSGKGGEDLRPNEAGRSGVNGDVALGGGTRWWDREGEVSGGTRGGERSRAAAEREEPEELGGPGRGGGGQRGAGAAAAAASPRRAGTHVLPPAGSARLSSCRRSQGRPRPAGMERTPLAGSAQPAAPLPRPAGAARQPPRAALPSLGRPGPLHRLQQLSQLESREGAGPASWPAAAAGRTGAARDKDFGNANARVLQGRPSCAVRRSASPGSLTHPFSGNTGQDKLWARNLSGRVASLDPISLYNRGRRSSSLKVR